MPAAAIAHPLKTVPIDATIVEAAAFHLAAVATVALAPRLQTLRVGASSAPIAMAASGTQT